MIIKIDIRETALIKALEALAAPEVSLETEVIIKKESRHKSITNTRPAELVNEPGQLRL